MITRFFDLVRSWETAEYAGIADFADKINSLLTVIILITCSVTIALKEYFTKPIACFNPHKDVTMSMVDELSIEAYCWVRGVYPLDMDKVLPFDDESWENHESKITNYYMWAPVIFGVQALLFYMPRLLWQFLTFSKMGIDMTSIVTKARRADLLKAKAKEDLVRGISDLMEDVFNCNREYRHSRLTGKLWQIGTKLCKCSKRSGCILSILYLIVKLLMIFNIIGQMEIMRRCLGFENIFFGTKLLEWRVITETNAFPITGLCRFRYQGISSVNTIVAYCTISANALLEKMAIFLWFWYGLVFLLTVASFLLWISRLTLPCCRHTFLWKFVRLSRKFDNNKTNKRIMCRFTREQLKTDGLFFLWMVQINAGDVITGDIITTLFERYRSKQTLCDVDVGKCESGNTSSSMC